MCKTLITSLFMLLTFTAFSQSTLQVKKDTVIVKKAEFAIENKTRDTLGFLYSTGNGRTQFKRLELVNLGDTALAIVGQDTITYKSANIGKSLQFKVGSAGAPVAGDTSYTNASLRLGNIKVWRNGLFQYRDATDGVMIDSVNGRIRFYPALAQADRIYIESLFGVSLNFQPSTSMPTVTVQDINITLPSSGLQLTGTITPNGNTISSYQWSQLTGPNTSTITNAATQTCTITGLISGTYTFRLTVTTAGGQQVSDDATVQVYPAGGPKILRVNFSNTQAPAVPGWFNVYGPVTNNHITATDPTTGWTIDNGGATGAYWTAFGGSNGNDDSGQTTGDDSGIVPDQVLKSFWFNYSTKYTTTDNLLVAGLNTAKTYTLKLVGSRKTGVSDARYGVWRINGGAELQQNALGNTAVQTVVTGVAPDATGKIGIAVYASLNTTYGDFSYINALIIEEEQ
ncbi:hypothetical protein SAMN04488505_109124 [Chitinophaga rupis]|uniref:PKD/Chitinase domain-containing protein n=1 Tax=Chitinophaga rupis TaxID=573321 RepID=A0A1H8F6S1_9BACT|nr:hypothetical protein [Chitinophaga rupis]SEN27553.1 hypothetical protein SAMN04488505_109124 [Chitinophaga rupis]